MKSKTIPVKATLAVALTLALVTLAFSTGRGLDQGNTERHGFGFPAPPNDHFAQQIVGSYLADFPDGSRLLLALNPGGATHRETSDDFLGLTGLPDLPFHFSGGGFGSWAPTGPDTIRLVELAFQFGEDGLVNAISKVTVDLEFNGELGSATGTAAVSIYLPAQDPLTEEPAISGPTFEGLLLRKIQ